MIRDVVPADRLLGEVHKADWPDPPPCPWGVRVPVPSDAHPEFLARAGRQYAVVRCALDKGHAGSCVPATQPSPLPRATLCRKPMRDDEFWVLFAPAPDDRLCRRCGDEADRLRALVTERFGPTTPLDDRRDR